MLLRLTWALVLLVLLSHSAMAQTTCTVTLAWDANTESDLSGYQLLYGTVTGVYGRTQVVVKDPLPTTPPSRNTTVTLTGTECTARWFFVVKAFNVAGLYSGPSNEVSVIPQAVTKLPRPVVRARPAN